MSQPERPETDGEAVHQSRYVHGSSPTEQRRLEELSAWRKVMMTPVEVPVLIVGGGPVGLCASLLLARHGVPSLLIERHPGASLYPKARLVNTRSMEVFRQIGLERAVRAIGLPPELARHAIWAKTLAGEEVRRVVLAMADSDAMAALSPTLACTTSQEVLEPALLAAIGQRGLGEVRFGCELVTLSQDDAGVTATVLDRAGGEETYVRARYLVGADGAHSRVRELLGIRMEGPAGLGHSINILFRADLTPWVAGRSLNLCFIQQPGAAGVLLAVDGATRWYYQAFYFPSAGQRAEDFTPERCVALLRAAMGVPDLAVEIARVAPWSSAARVAERFAEGRVFLMGDAAHEMPPAGGFGMNTGIQDAHNLAWKLAAVLGDWAGPALLDTYRDEREPVGRRVTEQTLANLTSLRRVDAGSAEEAGRPRDAGLRSGRPELFNELGLIFGAAYASAAVVPDGTLPPEVANPVTEYVPTASPGCRAPHTWLEHGGERRSTLDLFGAAFVLLAGAAGEAWRREGLAVAAERHVPLHAYTVGPGGDLADPDGTWPAAYGVECDGAVLVRPDGHVAWRASTAASKPRATLDRVLAGVLGNG